MVIDSGAVPFFVELLSNPVADVKEQVKEETISTNAYDTAGEHPALNFCRSINTNIL
jgi:Armadillo/beta-catenin-like repeat